MWQRRKYLSIRDVRHEVIAHRWSAKNWQILSYDGVTSTVPRKTPKCRSWKYRSDILSAQCNSVRFTSLRSNKYAAITIWLRDWFISFCSHAAASHIAAKAQSRPYQVPPSLGWTSLLTHSCTAVSSACTRWAIIGARSTFVKYTSSTNRLNEAWRSQTF